MVLLIGVTVELILTLFIGVFTLVVMGGFISWLLEQ